MTIDQLIKKLQDIRRDHGDLDVRVIRVENFDHIYWETDFAIIEEGFDSNDPKMRHVTLG